MLRAWTAQALIVVMMASAGASQPAHAQANQPAASDGKDAKAPRRSDADVQSALDGAAKALEAGKAEQVTQQINGLLGGGRLQARSMARALYLRGAAFHKQGKHAQAIADLTSALWLKGGLSDADRAAATTLRSAAYREAGLTDLADADAKRVGRSAAAAQVPAASAPAVVVRRAADEPRDGEPRKVAEPAPKASTSSGGGLSGFFSNLFGGSGAGSSAGSAGARPDAYRVAPARQPSVGEAWSTSVEARPAASAKQPASVRQETAAIQPREEVVVERAVSAPKPQGRYRLQVAAVRARAEAESVAARVRKEYSAALGGRELEVDETVIGNMGTFYRVRIGPFADAAEPGALCTKLRAIGLDCLIMAE